MRLTFLGLAMNVATLQEPSWFRALTKEPITKESTTKGKKSLVCEPERRFWKLSEQAVSSKFAMIEMLVLVLFLVVALVGIASCFSELSHLLESDAIGHVAMRAVSGGR
jgi:hypothetical protein